MYYIPATVDNTTANADPDVVAHIRTLTGFFFGGGDQLMIIRSLYNNNLNSTSSYHIASPALIAIKETLMATGGVVAGSSAGCDIHTSNIMISGGMSYTGIKQGSRTFWEPYPSPKFDELTAYTNGIGTFPHSLLDTHFENRGRHGRMIRLLADTRGYPTGSMKALGMDENTALVVTGGWNSRVGTVIGQRGVVLMDVSQASIGTSRAHEEGGGGDYWAIDGVRVSHLTYGDTIDLATFNTKPAPFKTLMSTRESNVATNTSFDIWASTEFADVDESNCFQFNYVASSLFKSKALEAHGYTKEMTPQYKVSMSKETSVEVSMSAGSDASSSSTISAQGFDGIDPTTGKYWFSYSNMIVSIGPK